MTLAEVAGAIRLGVDIGGTFTDVAIEVGDRRFTAKNLTTPRAPEAGVLTAVRAVMTDAGIKAGDVNLIIHGTTLATNALIERKGAKTALLTTEGFRDVIEIRHENRFEQYDVNIDLPPPLVPRRLRLPIRERIDAQGAVLTPLDEESISRAIDVLAAQNVEAVAVGLLHSFTNPDHERLVGEAVAKGLPNVPVTLSSDVSPEMREYERFSTACANAYLQPLMGRYLGRLEAELASAGFHCPMLLMTSGGGITTTDTATRFPVRLVESGPAGGAIFAACIARQNGLDQVVSFDMGGTTAKICLIDKARAQTARAFEVARIYRFLKGSGLPLRIPVIEMVEIGAGGGSIAGIDAIGRIAVGPQSAGSEPGPVCYGRGGTEPTVTDADLVLGRISPQTFSGGKMNLDIDGARRATTAKIGASLDLSVEHAALGISEMVDENMANAARVHAIESGKDLQERTLIAFGGAAPLHAARVAEKLGIARILIPSNAGVGSAVGLLRAPVAYEIVRGRLMRLSTFDAAAANQSVRRHARRSRSDRAARGSRREPWRRARRVHALSRPGSRDFSGLARARADGGRPRHVHDAVRTGVQQALQPLHSGRRNRNLELGHRRRRTGRRTPCRRAAGRTQPREAPRAPAGLRSSDCGIHGRSNLLARRSRAGRARCGPGGDRRRRHLDHRQCAVRCAHRPLRLY